MFARFNTIHERDRQQDRRTNTGRRIGPRLCIALRGKNERTDTWPTDGSRRQSVVSSADFLRLIHGFSRYFLHLLPRLRL